MSQSPEEAKTCSFSDNINTTAKKRDSFYNGLLLSAEEQREEFERVDSSSTTFSRNVVFIHGIIGEAAINMVRTAAALREEPTNPRILKAVVQSKVDNLTSNVGTLTSIAKDASTICSEKAIEGANMLGISQHGGPKKIHSNNNNMHSNNNRLGTSHHGGVGVGSGNPNEAPGRGGGGIKRLGSTQHGYGNKERGVSPSLGHTVHGYGSSVATMNHAAIERGVSTCLGRSMHGVQHQRQEWEKAQAKAKGNGRSSGNPSKR